MSSRAGVRFATEKMKSRQELNSILAGLREEGCTVVFTNGCFDLLHRGHVRYLQKARSFGDILVVAINDDESVRRVKGEGRPVVVQEERAEVLAALQCVDYVTTFSEDTPLKIIRELLPDILVKGSDWPVDRIVGRDVVERAGGRVVQAEYVKGNSTTDLLRRIRESLGGTRG